jgi:hypothetical protein
VELHQRGQVGETHVDLQRPLASTLMFDHPTIEAIAAHLLERLDTAAPAPNAAAPTQPNPAPLAASAVADMSDDDIARLLDERLEAR